MPEFKNVTLTWTQFHKLGQLIKVVQLITTSPRGELKDGEGNTTIEWDENEVKFNIPE